jgi:hypothetical protein
MVDYGAKKPVRGKSIPRASLHTVEADGVRVFYREAGPADAPVLRLLHGYPASSHMFRELIPRMATSYRVIAPDLPGFGFTTVPAERNYKYSFDALARPERVTAIVSQNGNAYSMKKGLVMRGIRSGDIGRRRRRRTARRCAAKC